MPKKKGAEPPRREPPLPAGIRRIVERSHAAAGVATSAQPAQVPEHEPGGQPIPEVRPEELAGIPWLDALLWHSPEQASFPGDYGIVIQPFIAGPTETGFKDARGAPLTYLVLFIMGIVGTGAELSPEIVQAALHDALARATKLAQGLSQEMHDASVRLLLARMPEWMARQLLPTVKNVRRT